MNDILKDIEVLEQALELDDFGRQLLIWNLIMEKKAVVQAFEDEQAPKEFEERWNREAPLTIESFRKQFNMEL